MGNYYVRNGNQYTQTSNRALDIYENLPVGTYTIKQDQFGNFFFEIVEDFTLPKKQYGEVNSRVERIVNTFLSREGSTGVLLSGEKGSGKSLLAKALSVHLAKQDIPTIVINTPYCGESFNTFMQQLSQPVVVVFDEFEKTYGSEEQEKLLTLLDGVYTAKKLFILTSNDKWRIDQHMRNRPGRIFYSIDFAGLSSEFIREYAEENLINKANVQGVVNVGGVFKDFNFDMLKALVEEMNRYNETAQESISLLNIKADNQADTFIIRLWSEGKEIDIPELDREQRLIPLRECGIHISIDDPANPEETITYSFPGNTLVKVDEGKYTFRDGNDELLLTKKQEPVYSYSHLL